MSRRFAFTFAILVFAPLGCGQPVAEVAQADTAPTAEPKVDGPHLEVAPAPRPVDRLTATTAKKVEEPDDKDLIHEDIGLDPKIEAALPEIERLDKKAVEAAIVSDPVGAPNIPVALPDDPPPPVTPAVPLAFPGRTGATKAKLIKEGGGSADSEKAVALGLAWLAKQQKQDGSWEFDVAAKEHRMAATGMALLPFLGAGETHKNGKGKYTDTVKKGLDWLVKYTAANGPNVGRISANMYEQAIATLALCEAYGLTKDPALRPTAQAAINFIMKSQGPNGSWGYGAGANGDTSIVGWQIQALAAAKLSKDLVVDDRVIKKAIKFLDFAAGGTRKSMYGYADKEGAAPGTALTAVGLLCRYYIDGWGPTMPGMIEGVAGSAADPKSGLVKNPPKGTGGLSNLYYYYYATQVVHFYEGEDWKNWNEGPKAEDGSRKGGMRDWVVKAQVSKDGANVGSWDPEIGTIGSSCGRLGTTALSLLTLEVYYRHLPLYKRGADGGAVKILEDK